MDARPGDRLVVESTRVGQPQRHGEVIEVLGAGTAPHFRVRWDDGHETTFFPNPGAHVERGRRRATSR